MVKVSVRKASIAAAASLAFGLGVAQAGEPVALSTFQLEHVTAGATARNILSLSGQNVQGSSSSSVSFNGSGTNISQQQQANGGTVVTQNQPCSTDCVATLNNGQASVAPAPTPVIPPRFNLLSFLFGR